MLLGTQIPARNDEDFKVMAQLGVTHISSDPAGNPHDWTLDTLLAHKKHVESFGLKLEMVQLPLSSKPIERSFSPDILCAGPERDKQIDSICRLIENISRAGIPSAKYNLNIIGIPRSEDEQGRGGSLNSTFRWDKIDQNAAAGKAGILSEEENWERIDYFLSKVVPVATEYKVRLACHPHDPYTPPGYKGVTRVLGTVEGLKKFVTMHESDYHGLNFCQGTVAEMLENPKEEIEDVIRWFAERKKIFLVHFRNIRGRRLSFMETFPDEGDMDMWRSAKLYAKYGYQHMLVPDHVPKIAGGDPQNTAFAFCYGYIAAMLEVLKREGYIE